MDHDTGARTSDHTRRSALRAGAAVAWTVPVMTVLGTSSAHADVASGPPTGGGTATPPPSVNTPTPGATTVPPLQPAGTPPVPLSTTTAAAALPTTASPAPTVRAARVAAAPELARTGSEAGPLAIAGLGLVAGGAAVIAATRRAQADAADGQS